MISFLAEVNAKYLYNTTRHFAVFFKGSNGDKAIFRSFVDPQSFYDSLKKIGASAGENMTLENKEKTHVQGDRLEITITWKDAKRIYNINEIVRDSNGNAIDMHFGGNLKRAVKIKTGCLLCLDSCPVGIGSNATYTYGAIEKRKEAALTGNPELLPPDGTPVIITVKRLP